MFGATQARVGPGQIARRTPIHGRVAALQQSSADACRPNEKPKQKAKQKPRAKARGFAVAVVWPASGSEPGEDRTGELIVQTGPNDVFLEADVVHRRNDGGVEGAEIDVEIFDLRAPVAHEGVFETAADGPAELAAGRRGQVHACRA